MKTCKKGKGTKDSGYGDRCYHYYNGECIKGENEPCYFNLGKSKRNG